MTVHIYLLQTLSKNEIYTTTFVVNFSEKFLYSLEIFIGQNDGSESQFYPSERLLNEVLNTEMHIYFALMEYNNENCSNLTPVYP